MAKGVPILGKDPLGKAKYANVTESGDLRVQLSGNLIETAQAMPVVPKSATTATILTRGIRRSTTSTASVTVPDNVVGAVIWCDVHGVTGTFDANQGLALSVSWRTPNKRKISDTQSTSKLATAGARAVVFGTALDPLNIATTGVLIPIGARPFGDIVAIISISGTFATEEGFDCEVFVQWLY